MNYFAKNIIKSITTLTLISAVSGLAQAQVSNETLNQLVRSAIEYAPKIKEQQQNVNMADYRTKIQEAALKPTVQSEIGVTRLDPVSKPSLGGTTIQFQPYMNYNANIGASYVVHDWGKQDLAIQKSKLESNVANTSIEGMKTMYAYQVANLYYGIVYLQKAIEVQKEQLQLVKDNETVISNRLKQGDALDYDQVSIQVRYKNAEARLSDLQSQLDKQYIYLASLTGKDVRSLIANNASFDLPVADLSAATALEQAQTSNVDLKVLREKDLIAEKDVKISELSMAPTLTAIGQVGFKNGYVPRINGEQPDFTDDFKLNTVLGIKLTIPVYSGGRGALGTSIAKVGRDQLKYSQEAVNQGLKRDLEAAQNDYYNAKNKLDLSEKNVFQAQYALKLANARYKNGVITQVEIEATQTALREAQLTQLQYQYQMTQAKLELNRLTGIKFW